MPAMNKLQRMMGKIIKRFMDSVMGTGLMQEEIVAEGGKPNETLTIPEYQKGRLEKFISAILRYV